MTHIHHSSGDPSCFGCKVKSIQLQAAPAFQPHYNWSVGKYVTTDREFRDEMKRCSERNCVATGIDHDYQPRYEGDIPQGDVTSTEKVVHDKAVAAKLKDPTPAWR